LTDSVTLTSLPSAAAAIVALVVAFMSLLLDVGVPPARERVRAGCYARSALRARRGAPAGIRDSVEMPAAQRVAAAATPLRRGSGALTRRVGERPADR
jgi:hypothetical protein